MRIVTNKKGFTLIELLVVIAIIAILAAILFPVFVTARKKGQQANCAGNLKQLAVAAQAYFGDYGDYSGLVNAGPPTTPWGQNFWNPFKSENGQVNPARFSPIFKYCKSADIMLCPAYKGKVRVEDIKCQQMGIPVGSKRNPAWTYTFCGSWGSVRPDTVRHSSKKAMWVEENMDPSIKHPYSSGSSVQVNDMSFSGTDITAYTHGPNCNVAFLDGHVGSVRAGESWEQGRWPSGVYIFRLDQYGN